MNSSPNTPEITSLSIRPATPSDAPAIATFFVESRKNALPFLPQTHSFPDVENWIRNNIIPNKTVLLAISSETPVAFLAFENRASESWIDHLYVAPGFIRKGIDSRLLRHTLPLLRHPVYLFTFLENNSARYRAEPPFRSS